MPSHFPSHAFFLDAIKESYDKDTSLSIYPKKISMYLYAWPVMPCTVGAFSIPSAADTFSTDHLY
jgi:hypothetical protein